MILSVVLLLGLLCFLFVVWRLPNSPITDDNKISLPSARADANNRINCNQTTVYCFEDAHCAKLCLDRTGQVCRNGICTNINVLNSTQPINECDATKGVVTFFTGNVALGRYDFLCRSVDLGIAPDNIQEPNQMCKNGTISIDYVHRFPDIRDCVCGDGLVSVEMAATSQVRPYTHCLSQFWADRII